MTLLLPAPDTLVLLEDLPVAAPHEVLVRTTATLVVPGVAPAPLPAPEAAPLDTPRTQAPVPDAAPAPPAVLPGATVPAKAGPAEPPLAATAFALPAEDAFPTLAELDAILAANAGPPSGAEAAERAAAAALLGLDPGIADDQALYDATIAALPDADADDVLATWLSEAEAGAPPPDWPDVAGDWQLG